MNKKEYKVLCEEIFNTWNEDVNAFSEFNAMDFDTEFMPEPYYLVPVSNESINGAKTLYVLNNNPGGGISWQKRDEIHKQYEHYKNYAAISEMLYNDYYKDLKGAPGARLNKMRQIADKLGFDIIEDIESFFLHSKSLNKNDFLSKTKDNAVVKEYTQVLTDYLREKPVLSVNAIRSDISISKQSIQGSPWLNHIAEIISLNISNAQMMELNTKENKVTSAALIADKKIMILQTGSNNIPNIPEKIMDEIRAIMKA